MDENDKDGAPPQEAPGTHENGEQSPDASQQAYEAIQHEVPPIDFTTFVLSLSTSVLVHLGEAYEQGSEPEVNLTMARQTIDLLGLLEDKTRGNLTGEEERMLHQVLFDLRMRFVACSNKPGS